MKKITSLVLLCFFTFGYAQSPENNPAHEPEISSPQLQVLLERLAENGTSAHREPHDLFTQNEKGILREHFEKKYTGNGHYKAPGDVYAYDGGYCSDQFGTFPVLGPYNINLIATKTTTIYTGDFGGDGVLYAIDNANMSLISIDKTTGAETTIGPLVNVITGNNSSGLAWNEADGTMYMTSLGNDITTLYSVDLVTGEATLIGPTNNPTGIWLAIDTNGNAYMADLNDNLYSVNLTTGASTLIGPLGIDINFAQDADFDPDTNILYMAGYLGAGVNNMYSVNTNTGAVFSLGTVNNNCAELTIVAIEGTPSAFPAPYCGPIDYNQDVQPVTYVEVAGISNTSDDVVNGSPAHEDFTAVIGQMNQNSTYPIILKGNTGGNFTNTFTVFIDWNGDEVFDNVTERYEIGSITNSTGMDQEEAIGSIVVPMAATLGDTRMRVIKRFSNTSEYATDSCSAGNGNGQAEDYTITILPAIECEAPTDVQLVMVTDIAAEISWTAAVAETNGYEWMLFSEGADPIMDTPLYSGDTPMGITMVEIEGLIPETSYDFYVSTDCDPDGTSEWAGPLTFTTEVLSIADNLVGSISLYPNPAANVVTIQAAKNMDNIKVYSILGKEVMDISLTDKVSEVNISGLASGVYLIKITIGNDKGVYRMIKK